MRKYSKIIITNLPAFYKINLFNEIDKNTKILVLFTGHGSDGRNADFYNGKIYFDYINLSHGLLLNLFIIVKNLLIRPFDELILSGWDSIYMWIALLFSHKNKNSVIIESSIHESNINGLKGFLKRIFLRRCIKVYVPGKSNASLIKLLRFRGEIVVTKGVGIFNFISQPPFSARSKVIDYIFVGRLIEVKNLHFLINVFNRHSELKLHIVGFGILEKELKNIANENIIFHGAVKNEDLVRYYKDADVFILPSKSETWGLVVEEALNNGLPVIVSNKVGCAEEIVNDKNGLVFTFNDSDSLNSAIDKMSDVKFYNTLRRNISNMNFFNIEKEQVECYL